MLYIKAHSNNILGLRLCERALSGAPITRTRERCLALLSRGVNSLMMKNLAPNEALLEVVSIACEIGDDWATAYASGFFALWLVNAGRAKEAGEHVAIVERFAEQLDDGILRGLAGLARGWVYLADDSIAESIAALRAVRELGDDVHQHHFIDMYIGLALFQSGDYRAAAGQFHIAMRNALSLAHFRGVSGAIEACGYIAERRGRPDEACRLLGAADQIRRRTGIPLFTFWIRHNEFANTALRSAIGVGRYEAAVSAGARMREEDVVNEAATLLREFAASAGDP